MGIPDTKCPKYPNTGYKVSYTNTFYWGSWQDKAPGLHILCADRYLQDQLQAAYCVDSLHAKAS